MFTASYATSDRIIETFRDFLTQRFGSVLKAWRLEIDPAGGNELLFSEFIDALIRVSWTGETTALWSALVNQSAGEQKDAKVGLKEISSQDGACLYEFRRWTVDGFGGPIDMFKQLTNHRSNASLTYEEFTAACASYCFTGDVNKVFHEALDLEGVGSISVNDLASLEPNKLKRKLAVDPGFVMCLAAAKAAARKMKKRYQKQQQVQQSAVREFRHRVKSASQGSFIRGWRKVLDLDENLVVPRLNC